MTEKFKMVKNIKVFMDPALRQELLEMYKESLKKTTVGAQND